MSLAQTSFGLHFLYYLHSGLYLKPFFMHHFQKISGRSFYGLTYYVRTSNGESGRLEFSDWIVD